VLRRLPSIPEEKKESEECLVTGIWSLSVFSVGGWKTDNCEQ
jgi:hypothetical protein